MNTAYKLCRFLHEGRPALGRVEEDMVLPLLGDMFGAHKVIADAIPLKDIRLLPPVFPSKVIGIGSNYKKHIAEMGRPTPRVPKVFLKPSTSVIGPNQCIHIPPDTNRVDHEAELGVVIKNRAVRIPKEDAMQYVLGYTCVNDVTARDFQKEDGTQKSSGCHRRSNACVHRIFHHCT